MEQNSEKYDWSFMAKIQDEEMDLESRKDFFDAMNDDLELTQSYEQFMSKWPLINNTIVKQETNVNSAWELQENRILKYQESKKQNKRWMAIAASVLLVIGVLYLYLPHQSESSYTTGVFEEREVNLPDGTKVYLNENTTLYVSADFNQQVRNVELSGEAFFEVKHDKNKPFVVKVNDHHVTVLGTSFNISSHKNDLVEVYLASGRISYKTFENQYFMTSGELAITTQDTTTIIPSTGKQILSWFTHQMVFSEVKLSEALTQISNAYKIPLVIEGADLSQCEITAEYNNMPISTIMETMSTLFDLEIEIKNDIIIVTAKSCNDVAS